ncbi:MAG: nitrous oxide reductase family maturation protein NosD [Candidatus Omnitrophica bacterium]|nr:nitrous oxide reductase family maturation protein NosD [Candidatus Omnitrophota bacterium]
MITLFLSLLLPYWKLKVTAPQYPKGLYVSIYIDRVEGDIKEIDTLNHYIGMRSLDQAAKLERKIALPGLIVSALLILASLFLRNKWSILFLVPTIVIPTFFAIDLYWWLRDFGLNLDPKAPLSTSVKPFVPPLLGGGRIAQFEASAVFGFGFFLSFIASFLALIALAFRFGGKRLPWVVKCAVLFFGFCFMNGLIPQAYAATFVVGKDFSYQTIQEAVAHASHGDVIQVRPGIYQGPLLVDRSIQLIGEGNPVINGAGKGTVVRIQASDVLVRGFVIQNSGDILTQEDAGILATGSRVVIEDNRFENVLFGIYLSQAPESYIRNNFLSSKELPVARRGDLIKVWYSDHVTIEGNQTQHGRDVVLWFSKGLAVKRNRFKNGRYGIHFMYCHDAVAEENRLSGNSVGAYLMYGTNLVLRNNQVLANRGTSGYGIGFKDMMGASIEHNVVVNNRVGLFFDTSSGAFRGNLIAHNDIGVELLPSASGNEFHGNSFVDNGEQVVINGLGLSQKNQWEGNFWSDYTGYDANRDGKGDVPYQAVQFFEVLSTRYSMLKIFYLSPAEQALDFAASLFPVFAPKPKLEDETPLVEPYLPPTKEPLEKSSFLWILISGLLLAPVGFAIRNEIKEVRVS